MTRKEAFKITACIDDLLCALMFLLLLMRERTTDEETYVVKKQPRRWCIYSRLLMHGKLAGLENFGGNVANNQHS